MRSLRSRIFLSLLKHRHWLRGQWRRPVASGGAEWVLERRAQVERGAGWFGRLPDDVEVSAAGLEGPPAEWVDRRGAGGDPEGGAEGGLVGAKRRGCLLYLHGGGYVMGSAKGHRPIVAKFVQRCGVGALVVDYRLAPEHPFPAALDDALAAYAWLLDEGVGASQIVLAGDSAGGGLALAVLLALRGRGGELPAGAAVLSPWTDLTLTGASYKRQDALAPDGAFEAYADCYAGGHDRRDPLVSPLHGDLGGLPPLFVSVGDDEAMLDDSVGFAGKVRQAGGEVSLSVGAGMVHCYPALSPLFPEATAALDEVCAFIRGRIRP